MGEKKLYAKPAGTVITAGFVYSKDWRLYRAWGKPLPQAEITDVRMKSQRYFVIAALWRDYYGEVGISNRV